MSIPCFSGRIIDPTDNDTEMDWRFCSKGFVLVLTALDFEGEEIIISDAETAQRLIAAGTENNETDLKFEDTDRIHLERTLRFVPMIVNGYYILRLEFIARSPGESESKVLWRLSIMRSVIHSLMVSVRSFFE